MTLVWPGRTLADDVLPNPAEAWGPSVEHLSTDALIAAVARVVRELLLSEYAEKQPGDRRPARAIEGAELYLSRRTEDARSHAAAVAKACSAARRQTLGYEHRIAEAARAVATAVTRRNDAAIRADLFEALAKTEEHLLYVYAVGGVYGKEAEVRARVLDVLRAPPTR